jgi:hypothetical protein
LRRKLVVLGLGAALALPLAWLVLDGAGRDDAPRAANVAAATQPAETQDGIAEIARAAALRRLTGRGGEAQVETVRRRPDRPEELAVCGHVGPAGSPFVVRVLLPPGFVDRHRQAPPGGIITVVEQAPGIAAVGGEAWARYCRDPTPRPAIVQGGPKPEAATGAAEAILPASSGGAATALALVRAAANLREGPSGRAPILRVARPGEVMALHGQAPGGWWQVGDDGGPFGWIHGSMLERVER